jgi:hypothetical protein
MSSGRITYAELRKRIDRLANSLLPADDPSGNYTDKQKDQIHAYILLAHAEIEEFFENLARYVIDRARRNCSPPQCSPTISRLILYKSARSKERIDGISTETVKGAVAYYENLLAVNHGIKADNLFKMFMPLGLTHDDFDSVLMQELNAFGMLRGGISHTAARLQQGSSPSAEKHKVDNILTGISHLDQKIRTLQ